MSERPRFVVDVMLGKLAKWLRLLGYDTAYLNPADDLDLVRLALAENRLLLTRDVELTNRRGVNSICIQSERIAEQLREIFQRLHLEADMQYTEAIAFSRCAECNYLLQPINLSDVQSRVPPYVYQTHTRFRECPNCGRVYWRGSHWARIVAEIQDVSNGDTGS